MTPEHRKTLLALRDVAGLLELETVDQARVREALDAVLGLGSPENVFYGALRDYQDAATEALKRYRVSGSRELFSRYLRLEQAAREVLQVIVRYREVTCADENETTSVPTTWVPTTSVPAISAQEHVCRVLGNSPHPWVSELGQDLVCRLRGDEGRIPF